MLKILATPSSICFKSFFLFPKMVIVRLLRKSDYPSLSRGQGGAARLDKTSGIPI